MSEQNEYIQMIDEIRSCEAKRAAGKPLSESCKKLIAPMEPHHHSAPRPVEIVLFLLVAGVAAVTIRAVRRGWRPRFTRAVRIFCALGLAWMATIWGWQFIFEEWREETFTRLLITPPVLGGILYLAISRLVAPKHHR